MWKVIFKRRPYFACGWFPRCEQQGKINVPNWTRFQQSQNLFDVDLVLQWYKNTRHVLGPWFTCVLLLIVTNIQQGDGHENATWRRVDLGHAFLPPLGSSASPDGGWISFREFLGCLPFFLIHKLHHPSILLKMRLFFLIVFPRYVGCALHLLSPYFHLCLRLLPHHFQPWEAGHAICKSRRGLRTQVPACARGWCLGSFFFFSKDTASLNKISSSKFPGWWQLEHFLFSPRSDLWGRWWTQLDGRILFSDGLGNSTTKIHQHPVSSLNTLFFFGRGDFRVVVWGSRWPLSGENLFFVASEASAAAYRPLDVDLAKVLPPRFALQYGCLVGRRHFFFHPTKCNTKKLGKDL